MAAGISLLALATQCFGVLGFAGGVLPGILVIGAAAIAWPTIRSSGRHWLDGGRGGGRALILAAAGLVLVACSGPETAWDALTYHLRIPSLYLLEGKIVPVPDVFMSYFPFIGESLMLLAKNIGGDAGARMLHAMFWLAYGAGIAQLASARWGSHTGPWAFGLWVSVPLGMAIAHAAYVEYFLVLPLVAGLLIWTRSRFAVRRSSAVLIGGMAGSAMGVKYLGILPAVVLFILVFGGCRPKRAPVLLFILGGIAATGYWAVRNALWTGNPVYPLLMGGPRWSQADWVGWKGDLGAFQHPVAALFGQAPSLLMIGRDGAFPYLLLAGAAVPVLWREWRDPGLLLAATLLLFGWWLSAMQLRYLLPAIALLCIIEAGIFSPEAFGPANRRRVAWIGSLGVWTSLVFGAKNIEFGSGAFDIALGKISVHEHQTRYFRPADFPDMLATVAGMTGHRDRIYVMGYPFAYDLERRVWSDSQYVRPPLYWWLVGANDPERIAIRAKQAGLAFIVWSPEGTRELHRSRPWLMDWTPGGLRAYRRYWNLHSREVARLEHWRIVALRRAAQSGPSRGDPPGIEAVHSRVGGG